MSFDKFKKYDLIEFGDRFYVVLIIRFKVYKVYDITKYEIININNDIISFKISVNLDILEKAVASIKNPKKNIKLDLESLNIENVDILGEQITKEETKNINKSNRYYKNINKDLITLNSDQLRETLKRFKV